MRQPRNPLPHVVNDRGVIINPFVQLSESDMRKLEKYQDKVNNLQDKVNLEDMEEALF